MIVNGKLKIDLDVETVDEVVRMALMTDYIDVVKEIKRINKKNENDPLTRIDKEDLAHAAERRVAYETLLQYYMVLENYEAFKKEVWAVQ